MPKETELNVSENTGVRAPLKVWVALIVFVAACVSGFLSVKQDLRTLKEGQAKSVKLWQFKAWSKELHYQNPALIVPAIEPEPATAPLAADNSNNKP